MEPCISAVADCLGWSTLDSVVAFLVQVCDEICPMCQLSRPLFQPCTDIKPLPEWKAEKVEYKMPTCVNILQLLELSAVQRKTAFVEQSWWPIYLKCLDQCHGVRSHGASSPQGWNKKGTHLLFGENLQWKWLKNLIPELLSRRWFIQVCLGKPSHENRQR